MTVNPAKRLKQRIAVTGQTNEEKNAAAVVSEVTSIDKPACANVSFTSFANVLPSLSNFVQRQTLIFILFKNKFISQNPKSVNFLEKSAYLHVNENIVGTDTDDNHGGQQVHEWKKVQFEDECVNKVGY